MLYVNCSHMDEALIAALENRIQLGESKASLRAEVVSHGHTVAMFEAAYAEAYARVHPQLTRVEETASAEEPYAPRTSEISHEPAPSRVRGDMHTLAVTPRRTGLIGYGEMLREGWRIANESRSIAGGLLVAGLLLFPLILAGVAILGGLAATLPDATSSIITLVALVAVGYVGLVLYASAMGFAFLRGVLKRAEPEPAFWPHFRWAWANIIPLFLVSLYVQIITNAGFVVFFIPGVIASVYLGYAMYALADENIRGFDALIRSFELVYGHFWAILGRKLFLILIVLLAVTPVGVALVVFPPAGLLVLLLLVLFAYVIICSTIALFESLQTLPPTHQFSEPDRATIKTWLRVVVVVAIVFAAFSFMTSAASFNIEREFGDFNRFLQNFNEEGSNEGGLEISDYSFTEQQSIVLIKQELTTARIGAELYYMDNNDSYLGVCSDADGINTNMRYAFDAGAQNVSCEDGPDWFVAEAELLDSGIYYCVDSYGNTLENNEPMAGMGECASARPYEVGGTNDGATTTTETR